MEEIKILPEPDKNLPEEIFSLFSKFLQVVDFLKKFFSDVACRSKKNFYWMAAKKILNMPKVKSKFFFEKWGYTQKDFKNWGKKGGRPAKYANDRERYKAYRRRKIQKRIESGEVKGILNITTGRINKR